jgi:hypothetical protein
MRLIRWLSYACLSYRCRSISTRITKRSGLLRTHLQGPVKKYEESFKKSNVQAEEVVVAAALRGCRELGVV